MDHEALGTGIVRKHIAKTQRLVPFICEKDKEPVWDGYVAVYNRPEQQHRKDDLIARVDVQVKGHELPEPGETLCFPVELADLRGFRTEGVTVFFVGCFDAEGEETALFYRVFKTSDVEALLEEKGGQQSASLPFARFPGDRDAAEAIFLRLAREKAGQPPEPLASFLPAPLSAGDMFRYNAGLVGFFGRETERGQLDAFLAAPGAFRWWGVIAPGGAGKSRLAYEWGGGLREAGWTVRFLRAEDYENLRALSRPQKKPLLLIADYARQQAAALGAWMETLCGTARENPVRLLLLERDEGIDAAGETPWEKELYSAGNELHLRRARHGKLLRLPAMEPAALRDLICAFAAALRERDDSLPALTEAGADMLLERLGALDGENRPLYAMILTDAWLRDGDAAHWTQEKLLSELVLREDEQLKNAVRALRGDARPDKTLLDAALRLRRLATALGASGDRALAELLALEPDLNEALQESARLYRIPSVEELLLYLGLLRYEGDRPLVPALRPDPLGEYALLHWLTEDSTRPETRAAFFAAALQDGEILTFFQRLYADYAPLLNAAPERWEKLLPGGMLLDDARASRYTDLLYYGSRRCTDREQRKRLLDETARLAAAVHGETPAAGSIFNNLGLLYKAVGDYPRALEYHQKALAIFEKVYGAEHPDTAMSYNNLSVLYYNMGDYPTARDHVQKAVAILEKTLGSEHPYTKNSRLGLSLIEKRLAQSK